MDKFDEQLVFVDSLTGGEIKLKSDSDDATWMVCLRRTQKHLSEFFLR